MRFLLSLPALLSLLTLAAHFLRADVPALVLAYVVIAAMLLVPRPWARRTVQVALLLGVAEWLSMIAQTVPQRVAAGSPYHRYVVIIGATAAVALLGAALLQHPRMRRVFAGDVAGPARADDAPGQRSPA